MGARHRITHFAILGRAKKMAGMMYVEHGKIFTDVMKRTINNSDEDLSLRGMVLN